MKYYVSLLLIITIVGCGTRERSTGAMQVGPDTFRILAEVGIGDLGRSQKKAFSEANAYCASLGKKMVTTNTKGSQYDGYEVTFRCLKDGDPDLIRPDLQKSPDTVIQVK